MRKAIPVQNILIIVLLLFMGCVEDSIDIFRPSDITRPNTPTGLTANASNSTIHLTWNGITDEDLNGYNVYRATVQDTTYTSIASNLTGTAHTDSISLAPETVYHYAVTASDGSGNESFPSNIVSASLAVDTYTLTIAVNNSLWGTTTPASGPHTYKSDTPVNLSATPANGYRFVNWSGPVADTDSAQTTVTVTGDITVTANFEAVQPVTHTLTMQVNNTDWGSTSPVIGEHTYSDGAQVTISATPANGYRFVSWSGSVADADSAQTTVSMTGDITVTANFEEIPLVTHVLTIQVNNTDWGSTSPETGDHTYADGTKITISATPSNGYRFVNWSGPVTDKDAIKTSVSMSDDITVTATFEAIPPDMFVLTMDKNEAGGGVTIPSSGTHTYPADTIVDVTAVPAQGYYFAGWEGPVANSSEATTTVTMTGHITVTALFEKVDYTLSIDIYHEDWGNTSPAMGIHTYPAFTEVPLTAIPAEGYRFVRWTGNVTDTSNPTTSIVIERNETITAIFEEIPPDIFTLNIQVYPDTAGNTTPAIGFHEYQDGAIATLVAAPAKGYRFVNWSGNVADPNSATTTISMTDNMSVTANFERITHTLTLEVIQTGWGTTSPALGTHTYNEGDVILITATPVSGYRFIRWTGNVADPNSVSTTIKIEQNETVTAVFEAIPKDKYVLTMAVNSAGWGTVTPASGTHIYDMNSVVTITASPAEGFRFVSWTGDVANADSDTTTTTITGHKTVTAVFEQIPPEIYVLTMAADPPGLGTTSPSVGGHNYEDGSIVAITATPAAGKQFVSWTGDVADTDNATTTVTVTSDMTVTANFEAIVHTLTMAVDPLGYGTTSPAAGAHNYDEGTLVDITATPASGYRFVNWTGAAVADANSASTSVTVTGDLTLTANFVPEYTLTMAVDTEGHGTTDPAIGAHIYAENDEVTITATPAVGYVFDSWTGAVVNPNNSTTTITVTGDMTVTANFVPEYTLTLAVDPIGKGSTTPAAGAHTYAEDTVVPITATPVAGQRFVNWTGDAVTDANNATTTVTMDGDKSVTANFVAVFDLTMAINTPGAGSTTPATGAHTYDTGTVVDISATPAAGYRFVNWTGDVTDANSATTTVTVNAAKTVTANFVAVFDLTMAVNIVDAGTTTPAIGAHTYDTGTVVDITATPAAGYRFDSWSGDVDDPNSASTTVTMGAAKTVTANFIQQFTLTTATSNIAQGTTTPAPGDHVYDSDTVVDISALPEEGFQFINWTGTVADANSATTTVTVTGNMTVTANFEAIPPDVYTLTMAANPADEGTTTPAVGGHQYDDGTVVDISATPVAGHQFVNWTGTVADANSATTTVTVTGNTTVTANFEAITHTLTMAINTPGSGTTTPVTGDHTYDEGTVVDISATPAAGYRFDGWTGDVANAGSATTTVTVDAAKTVTANFVAVFDLTMAVNIVDAGTTTPAIGANTYDTGTVVDISATPAAGYRFDSWTGDVADPNSASTTVTVDAAKTVTANFVVVYDLTMAVNIVDAGTTTPAIGANTYDTGTVVDITATPAAGYRFDSWTGDVADPNSASTTVTVDAAKTVTANFVVVYDLTMAVNIVDAGTTTPAIGANTYDTGTVVDITATPAAGYRFDSWTGDVTDPNSASTTVTIDAAKTVTANFVQQFTLTIATSNIAQGTTDPAPDDHVYDSGTVVDISALPEAGFQFVSWTGDAVTAADSATTTITLDGDKSVTATFEAIP